MYASTNHPISFTPTILHSSQGKRPAAFLTDCLVGILSLPPQILDRRY
jgi:hypothetical protein